MNYGRFLAIILTTGFVQIHTDSVSAQESGVDPKLWLKQTFGDFIYSPVAVAQLYERECGRPSMADHLESALVQTGVLSHYPAEGVEKKLHAEYNRCCHYSETQEPCNEEKARKSTEEAMEYIKKAMEMAQRVYHGVE